MNTSQTREAARKADAEAIRKAYRRTTTKDQLANWKNHTPNKAQQAQPPQSRDRHSPLPWSADKWATGYTVSATDHSVCHLQDCNNEEANARLIVQAVNHAEKLAEAIRLAIDKMQRAGIGFGETELREALAAYEAAQ